MRNNNLITLEYKIVFPELFGATMAGDILMCVSHDTQNKEEGMMMSLEIASRRGFVLWIQSISIH